MNYLKAENTDLFVNFGYFELTELANQKFKQASNIFDILTWPINKTQLSLGYNFVSLIGVHTGLKPG